MSYIGVSPFEKTARITSRVTANGSANTFYPDGGYNPGYVDVFVDGTKKTETVHFTATDGLSVVFNSAPANNATVEFILYRPVSLNVINWSAINNKPDPQITLGGDASGNVILNDLTSNTLNLTLANSGVVANAYGNSSQIPVITVDAKGRVTNATTTAVAGVTGFSYTGANNTFAITTGDGSTFAANISANSIAALALGSTGVVANTYGNSTAIPVITVDEDGRISNATTTSVSGVTGVSYTASNSTITVSTSITNYDAVLTSGNSSVQGLLKVVDSVANGSVDVAASANSVKTAYELAGNAVSNATSYAAAAYSNAVSQATTLAGTAYSNATSYADTASGTAYTNAVSQATTLAGTAYTNAVSQATTLAGTAYTNAVSQATTLAGNAYTNAVSQATALSGNAYSNAVSQATTLAGTAYSNATAFAANADNISSGTLSGSRVQANNGIVANSSGLFVNPGTGVTVNATGVHIGQNVANTANVAFSNMTITGNLVVQGTTTTVNTVTLSVQDNMIYLNANSTVTNPDLGFAGNYNDGSYAHAGFFRDATDARWKVFDGYLPEPDASAYIDTANASFHLADLQANVVYANVTGNVTGNVSGSANSATYLGGNTASDLRSYSDTVAGTAYTNATSYASTIAGTAYSNAVSVAASDATSKAATAYSNATSYAATIAGTAYSNAVSVAASDATSKAATAYSNATSYADTASGTAYSNATSYAATIAGTAYSNATAFAANASNISSGTISPARLPQANSTSNGAVLILDSVSNTAVSIYAAAPNSVKTAYELAGNAVSNAVSYAATAYSNATSYAATIAGTAYSNATSYAATIAGTAYSNAVSVAASDATSKAATAYSNATSYAATIAGTAYSNATSYAATIAGTAYSNAVAYAASNSYVNSTFLKLSGGTMTGQLVVGTGTNLSFGSQTRQMIDLWSTSYGIGVQSGTTYFRTGTRFSWHRGGSHSDSENDPGGGTVAMTLDGSSTLIVTGSVQTPLFYDSDNTSYYTNPAGTSVMRTISQAESYKRSAAGVGYLDGGYASQETTSTTGAIYTIGGSYYPTSTSLNNMYGIGYCYGGVAGLGGTNNWGLYVAANGTARHFLDTDNGIGYATGSYRAPLFYDYNDTSYYCDPASQSVFNGQINTGDVYTSGSSWHFRARYTSGSNNYHASFNWNGMQLGNNGANYLVAGRTNVGGYFLVYVNSTSDFNTVSGTLSSRFDSDGIFYNYYSVRSPIFYDYNDTSYYVDPASTTVLNALNAVTKSFLIDHPTKQGKKLRYACLEGPENGVYVRGKLTKENTIELPEYWTKLVDPDSITVSLTPIGKGQKLSVLDISNNQVVVEEEDSKDINCFYVVYGERVDVDKLEVEV